MTVSRQIAVGVALLALPAAIAHAVDTPTDQAPAPTSASEAAVTSFAEVDRALLEALRAPDQAARKAAMRRAQRGLDALAGASQPTYDDRAEPSAGEGGARWLARTEQRLDRHQDQTRRELRETLMHSLWDSPYGGISGRDLTVLGNIGDALRVLRELRWLEGGDGQALAALQSTYWTWLENRRQAAGLEQTAVGAHEHEPVFAQRVLSDDNGRAQIYQLRGREDRTLHWTRVPAQPVSEGLLSAQALTLDPAGEAAPWLLVVEGAELAERLQDHRHWLATIQDQARLVLRPRKGYGATLQAIPDAWFTDHRWPPYVLPAIAGEAAGGVHLIEVASERVLGSWPLAQLAGPSATAIKGLINRIIAAGALP